MQAEFDLTPPGALQATPKQLAFARAISTRIGVPLAQEALRDRASLSAWIDRHKNTPTSMRPSSRQMAFAERIARLKRRSIPPECFQDKTLLSRWIDGNKPK
jgi:hypothetical protein